MLKNVITFLSCALEEGLDPSDDDCMASYFVYCLKVPPDLIRCVVLPHVDFLCSRDVFMNEHGCIGVVEVPIFGSNRVLSRVRPSNVAKDIFSNIAQTKHMFHAAFPNTPIHVIQGLPGLCNSSAFNNGDIVDRWHCGNNVGIDVGRNRSTVKATEGPSVQVAHKLLTKQNVIRVFS